MAGGCQRQERFGLDVEGRALILATVGQDALLSAHDLPRDVASPLTLGGGGGTAFAIVYDETLEELGLVEGSLRGRALGKDEMYCRIPAPREHRELRVSSDGTIELGPPVPGLPEVLEGVEVPVAERRCAGRACRRLERIQPRSVFIDRARSCKVLVLFPAGDGAVYAATEDGYLHRVTETESSSVAALPGASTAPCRSTSVPPAHVSAAALGDGGRWLVDSAGAIYSFRGPGAELVPAAPPAETSGDTILELVVLPSAGGRTFLGAGWSGRVWRRTLSATSASGWSQLISTTKMVGVPGGNPRLLPLPGGDVLYADHEHPLRRIDRDGGVTEVLRLDPLDVGGLPIQPAVGDMALALDGSVVASAEVTAAEHAALIAFRPGEWSPVLLGPIPAFSHGVTQMFRTGGGFIVLLTRGFATYFDDHSGFCESRALTPGNAAAFAEAAEGKYVVSAANPLEESTVVFWFEWPLELLQR